MALAAQLDVSELHAELGSALQAAAVGDVDRREYEVLYIRSDVERKYSEDVQDRIFESLVFEYLGRPAQESDFEPLGELQFTVRSFENGNVVFCWDEEFLLFVAIDASEHFVPVAIRLLEEQLGRKAAA